MEADEYLAQLVSRARRAQQVFEIYSQEKVDQAVRAVGKAVYDNAEMLARMAVDETRMGEYDGKVAKCRNKSKSIWWRIKDCKSRGLIDWDEETGIAKVAKPIGVIGSVTPTTNPVITPMHNSMCALKCGNAIIICPHPRAKRVGVKTVELINAELARLGMPEDLIQIIPEPTMELSAGLMSAVDVCICTGGPGLVKTAYSSGKPAFGVGPGNVQAIVDRDVNIKDAAKMIIDGRTFDNGILCTCEQSIICPREKEEEMIAAVKEYGAYYIDNEEDAAKLRNCAFPDGRVNKEMVGKGVKEIANMTGIPIPKDAKLIVTKTKGIGKEEYLAKEKMFPVLAMFLYDTWEDGVEIARTNLEMEGSGHSCAIHSNTPEHINYVSTKVNVSRYLVNQVAGTSTGGALDNGLNPTTTLGCGTWGNNVISENLWYYHLMNVSRISYRIKNAVIPTDEEIWTS